MKHDHGGGTSRVNLHLEVLGLRPDGFHELAMVMQSIDLADVLTCRNRADAQIELSCDDPSLSLGDDNLIMRRPGCCAIDPASASLAPALL